MTGDGEALAGGPAPQLRAVPDGRVRLGGRLLIGSCLCWIVNGLILLGAFISAAISSADTIQTNPRLTIIRAVRDATIPAFPAIPATVALIVGGVLFALGLWFLQRGTIAREWSDSGAREVYEVPRATGRNARVAAICILVYAVVGGIAFLGFAMTASETGVEDASTDWLLVWLAASVVLMVGAGLLSAFGRSLSADTGGLLILRGFLITDYAISNLVGLTFFVIASLLAAEHARLLEVLGVFSQLLVLPLTIIIVFSALLFDSLALPKTRALARPVQVGGSAFAGSAPMAGGARAGDEDLILRLQSRIDRLEGALRQQEESISALRFLMASRAETVAGGPGAVLGEPPNGPASAGRRARPRSGERPA